MNPGVRDSLRAFQEQVRILQEELAEANRGAAFLAYELEESLAGLRASEERYRALVENALQGIIRTDPASRLVLYANPAMARILGYHDGAELVSSVEDVDRDLYADPHWGDEFRAVVAATGAARDFESQMRRKDGTLAWVREHTHAVRDAEGRFVHFESIVEDITEGKERADRLRLLESVVVHSVDAVVVMEADELYPEGPMIEYVNDAFTRQTGYMAEDVVGRRPSFLCGPDTDLEQLRLADRALAAGRPAMMEWINYRKDGTPFWVESRIHPVTRDDGLVLHYVSVRRDCTAQREMRERLRNLSMAVEQSADHVIITDADGVIQYVNPAFEALTGWSCEEAVGRTPRILKSGEHDQAFYRELWNTIRSGRIFRGLLVNRKRDGTLYWEEKVIAPLRDVDGRITRFLSSGRDVTEKRALEDQLRHAQRIESLGQFAGGIAHDFNNLLTVIATNAELLKGRLVADPDSFEDLLEIARAAGRGAELTAQLLAYGRRSTLRPEVVDLGEIVRGKERVLRRLLGARITLVVDIDPATPAVLVDPGLLDQVVMNLCINARDAMPEGGSLTLATRRRDVAANQGGELRGKAGSYGVLMVSDEGTGMDQTTQARVFEPFFTTKEAGRGTGLGLSTVQGIVEQSGGFIEVRSAQSEGTTFEVHLPLAHQLGDQSDG